MTARLLACCLAAGASLCYAADIAGNWIAELSGGADPTYARVSLQAAGGKVTGTWGGANAGGANVGGSSVEGTSDGQRVTLAVRGGTLTATAKDGVWSGEGQMAGGRGRGGAGAMQHVTWKLSRPPRAQGGPKT